ncbi:MAG: hypothetical protein ACYDIC_18630 [Desulfobaccales bacterium]
MIILRMLLLIGMFIFQPSLSFSATSQMPALSDMVNLYGSSTTGAVSNFVIVSPDGTSTNYTIPSGKSLVITDIELYYSPNSTPPTGLYYYVLGNSPYHYKIYDYYSGGGSTFRNYGSNLSTGIAISNNNNLKVRMINTSGSTIPGQIEVRLIGYHISLTSAKLGGLNLLLFN